MRAFTWKNTLKNWATEIRIGVRCIMAVKI